MFDGRRMRKEGICASAAGYRRLEYPAWERDLGYISKCSRDRQTPVTYSRAAVEGTCSGPAMLASFADKDEGLLRGGECALWQPLLKTDGVEGTEEESRGRRRVGHAFFCALEQINTDREKLAVLKIVGFPVLTRPLDQRGLELAEITSSVSPLSYRDIDPINGRAR